VGWSDVNLSLLAMMLLATLLSSAILLGLIRAHHRSSLAEIESKKNLWFLANHDVLTLLPNRNLFMDRIGQAIARSQRQGTNFGILFLDLNGFKEINDTYGHNAGDELLRQVAQRLQGCIRADDSVARLGGDEFVVLLEGIMDAEVMESIARKIRTSMAPPFAIAHHQVSVSTSIGKATFPMQGKTPDELIKAADARMYAEKNPERPHAV
jgi:diguanylate cyclase (GGDEF)-like protein